MRKNRREWDEGAHLRALPSSYRSPTEEIMTMTDEQFEASLDVFKHHRTLEAILTDIGLVVQPPMH